MADAVAADRSFLDGVHPESDLRRVQYYAAPFQSYRPIVVSSVWLLRDDDFILRLKHWHAFLGGRGL